MASAMVRAGTAAQSESDHLRRSTGVLFLVGAVSFASAATALSSHR